MMAALCPVEAFDESIGRKSAHACLDCQRSKTFRRTITPIGDFTLPPARFTQLHIEIIDSSIGSANCSPGRRRITSRSPIVRYPSHINNSSSFDRMHYFIAAQELQLVTGNV
jgi:hypothetical protein